MQDSLAHLTPSFRVWLRRRLLSWFSKNARDLPWRHTRNPYAIWVSEVMLQQTQVATVIPYFKRFLESFPDINTLAQADEQEVLRRWEGLGYYRRARDLHRAAKILWAKHEGHFPDDLEIVSDLPGLGRYTVNAVLSQAFERRLPILEANSVRVLCRLLGVDQDPRLGPVQRLLWQAATALLPVKNVGHFNQALMELGALVCKPVQPRCGQCPVALKCQARLENKQEQIPVKAKEPTIVEVQETALVIRKDTSIFLVQRPASGRWANMWEVPHTALLKGETHEQAGTRLLEELGLKAALGCEIATLKHSVTRFRITMVCLEACFRGGYFNNSFYTTSQWLTSERLFYLPVSAPQRRLMKLLVEPRQQQLF